MTTEAFITPAVIRWARERNQWSPHELADKVSVKEEVLNAWEQGDLRPSFSKAKVLAKKLRIPFGYLFLTTHNGLRSQSNSWTDFLTNFMHRAEDIGVLVIRSSVVENNNYRKLSVSEFRGFAISDSLAPLVFINGQDAKAAQIFTLAHELAHLWVGASGVSNPDYRRATTQQMAETEQVCNSAAAETLVPASDFLGRWRTGRPVELNLQSLAEHYRVSSLVVSPTGFD